MKTLKSSNSEIKSLVPDIEFENEIEKSETDNENIIKWKFNFLNF